MTLRGQAYEGSQYETSTSPKKVPGNPEAEPMSNALSEVLTVSKNELTKTEARLKRAREKKRAKKT